jgi:hypothetical protein
MFVVGHAAFVTLLLNGANLTSVVAWYLAALLLHNASICSSLVAGSGLECHGIGIALCLRYSVRIHSPAGHAP